MESELLLSNELDQQAYQSLFATDDYFKQQRNLLVDWISTITTRTPKLDNLQE